MDNSVKKTELEKEILWGEREALKQSKKRTVRVFISSTFTDTKTERNYLLREIFPQVRDYCQLRGVEFRYHTILKDVVINDT